MERAGSSVSSAMLKTLKLLSDRRLINLSELEQFTFNLEALVSKLVIVLTIDQSRYACPKQTKRFDCQRFAHIAISKTLRARVV